MKYAIYGNGSTTASYEPRTARAYCEGRVQYFADVAVGGSPATVTSNPFTEAVERENYTAWAAGYTDAPTIAASATHCAV